jgi:branched-chain amino acid transport system substrate-binding protein
LDKATKAAVEQVNKSGGIMGREVKLITEDVEGNPTVGTRKMRRLVQRERVDFLIGPLHSGVGVAVAPVALELKTPMLCQAMTEEMTGTLANRYIFRTASQVRVQAEAGTKWALDNIGKKWSFAYADYSWGWSHFKETAKRVEAGGGRVLSKVAVPIGTKDFLPYLTQIDPGTEVLYGVFIGADEIAYFTQANTMGLHKKMKMYSVVCTIEAVDTRDLGEAVEGAWFQEYLPRRLKYQDTAENRNLRKLCEVDPEGKQIGGPRTVAGSHYYANWEAVYWIKRAIEKSNWKSKKDTPNFVAALEGMAVKQSNEFPQGDKVMRAEDHQVFTDQHMSHVENFLLEVKFKIPMDKFLFEPPVNLTKMSL